ncbi:P2X purinoceptor 4 [Trichoplax sp. H2]|nr:P2X purinoceptor 4 [Trichoplax sp. H2]|eukprot:RDD40737.1 P2X purinoceptor 4 [Trichoplax sp. H2]
MEDESSGCFGVLEYNTAKIVHIKSKKIGILYRLVQLIIVGYVIGYAIVYKKGYQIFDQVQSSVTSKVKGVAFTNFSQSDPSIGTRIWDTADYVVPAEENDATFVITNMIITPNQTNGICSETHKNHDAHCTKDMDCPKGIPIKDGHGVRTGKCDLSTKTCKIYAWCPIETDQLKYPFPILEDAKDFTLLIKNSIQFPKFQYRKRNIANVSSDFLKSCRYSPNNAMSKLCPIFTIDSIVNATGESFNPIAYLGGVIAILIRWDCDLDFGDSKCLPEYTFQRLDNPNVTLSPGYNFRFPIYYQIDNTQHRTLTKAYGIRFIFIVFGQAGKFNIVPLLLNLGSGLALLSIATVLCDIIVLYFIRGRMYYYGHKYEVIEEADEESESFIQPVENKRL